MSMMIRGGIFAVTIIAVLTTALAYSAQNGPTGRWWRQSTVVNQLKLTDGEIQRLEKAFEASRLKMIKLKSQVEAEQFKLQNLVEKRDIDERPSKPNTASLKPPARHWPKSSSVFLYKCAKSSATTATASSKPCSAEIRYKARPLYLPIRLSS